MADKYIQELVSSSLTHIGRVITIMKLEIGDIVEINSVPYKTVARYYKTNLVKEHYHASSMQLIAEPLMPKLDVS